MESVLLRFQLNTTFILSMFIFVFVGRIIWRKKLLNSNQFLICNDHWNHTKTHYKNDLNISIQNISVRAFNIHKMFKLHKKHHIILIDYFLSIIVINNVDVGILISSQIDNRKNILSINFLCVYSVNRTFYMNSMQI